MLDRIALVRMPSSSVAPGYRQSLGARSRFSVEDFGAGIVGVAPAEGPGAAASYFELIKVADAATDLTASATWSALRSHPPRQRSDVEADGYRDAMVARGREVRERNPGVESEIVAFALAAFGAAQAGDLDELLKINLPPLFEQFPHGSLWQVVVSDVLLARLAFGRTQLALKLTPDLPIGEEMDQLKSFSDLTLTSGIDFSAVLTLALVALSPAVQGFLIPAMPHTMVFCFGSDIDLRRPYPTSFSALYRPSVLNDAEGLDRSPFTATPAREDGPELLAWWVARLDELYSHATDPTRFTDDQGYYDAAAQTAWMITFERVIGDALTLLAEPQATDLDRVQMAFDLLDKAESLLGYGRNRSGKGFEALLRRTQCVPRLRDAYRSLGPSLGTRLGDEAERLFDDLYAEVRSNTLKYRLTDRGARIGSGEPGTLRSLDNDTLVSSMCRAIRNSSHGVLDILRDRDDGYLLAANTGGIPAELPALVPLIALGLFADVPSLIDGSWRTKLVGRR